MKNVLIGTLLIAVLFVFGCKKDSATVTPIPTDGWTIGTKSYKQNLCARDTSNGFTLSSLSFTNGTTQQGEAWSAIFGSYPKFSGTYTISKNYTTGSGLGSNELVILSSTYNSTAANPLSNTYFSTGIETPAVGATVTITNGKITLSLPPTWVKKADFSSGTPIFGTDRLRITGTMIEN